MYLSGGKSNKSGWETAMKMEQEAASADTVTNGGAPWLPIWAPLVGWAICVPPLALLSWFWGRWLEGREAPPIPSQTTWYYFANATLWVAGWLAWRALRGLPIGRRAAQRRILVVWVYLFVWLTVAGAIKIALFNHYVIPASVRWMVAHPAGPNLSIAAWSVIFPRSIVNFFVNAGIVTLVVAVTFAWMGRAARRWWVVATACLIAVTLHYCWAQAVNASLAAGLGYLARWMGGIGAFDAQTKVTEILIVNAIRSLCAAPLLGLLGWACIAGIARRSA
jgi:hypothetical protein